MSGDNISPFGFDKENNSNIGENSKQRFVLKSEKEVEELVDSAQAESTKHKTIYAVNTFKGIKAFINFTI